MATNKTLTTKIFDGIKEYGPAIGKAVGTIALAYVASDILDSGREAVHKGLESLKNPNINALVNHPITTQITTTIPQLAGNAILYFLPRRYMNSGKKSNKGPYYTEQFLKYMMQWTAVYNGLEGVVNCVGTTLPYISKVASTAYNTFMSRVGSYVDLASLAVPILDGKNKSGKKGKK